MGHAALRHVAAGWIIRVLGHLAVPPHSCCVPAQAGSLSSKSYTIYMHHSTATLCAVVYQLTISCTAQYNACIDA